MLLNIWLKNNREKRINIIEFGFGNLNILMFEVVRSRVFLFTLFLRIEILFLSTKNKIEVIYWGRSWENPLDALPQYIGVEELRINYRFPLYKMEN
jgi:hypothetical protein